MRIFDWPFGSADGRKSKCADGGACLPRAFAAWPWPARWKRALAEGHLFHEASDCSIAVLCRDVPGYVLHCTTLLVESPWPGMSSAPSDVKLTLERTSSTLLQQIEVQVLPVV